MPPVMYQSANITATADQLNEPGTKTKSTPMVTIQSPMRIGQLVVFMNALCNSSGVVRVRSESRMRLNPRAMHYLFGRQPSLAREFKCESRGAVHAFCGFDDGYFAGFPHGGDDAIADFGNPTKHFSDDEDR